MEGKILSNGQLSINRKGQWKEVRCIYDKSSGCSDACVGFGETYEYNKNIMLDLCTGQHIFDVFKDERE